MLLHTAIHQPEVINTTLWPMAVELAIFVHNHIPSMKTGISPNDSWSRTRYPLDKLDDLHVFGCPVHTLQKKLQDWKSIPRWEKRLKWGMHVGMSP